MEDQEGYYCKVALTVKTATLRLGDKENVEWRLYYRKAGFYLGDVEWWSKFNLQDTSIS